MHKGLYIFKAILVIALPSSTVIYPFGTSRVIPGLDRVFWAPSEIGVIYLAWSRMRIKAVRWDLFYLHTTINFWIIWARNDLKVGCAVAKFVLKTSTDGTVNYANAFPILISSFQKRSVLNFPGVIRKLDLSRSYIPWSLFSLEKS